MRSLLSLPVLARTALLAALAVPLSTSACIGTAVHRAPSGAEARIVPQLVSDADFAGSLHKVLRDGTRSQERLAVLIGVVRRQLAHAAQRFAAGHEAEGTAGVIGALYLLRTGEGRQEMVDAPGERAIAGAIERVSTRGDEGRALALMKMRAAALPAASKEKAEVDEHLTALTQWMAETRTGGSMRRLGAEERTRVARALLDPANDALEDAAAAIDAWIAQAIRYNDEFRQSGKRPEREEAVEASRALESGGATLAALFLRYGDAAGALKHIDDGNARRVIQPGLYARIHSAAVSDAARPNDWQALAMAFAQNPSGESDAETDIDPEMLGAGLWGTALEAYRRDPKSIESALLVGRALVHLGMPEAAPLVVGEALAAHPEAKAIGAGMMLLLEAIVTSSHVDDLDAARRTFNAAGPILDLAAGPTLAGQLDPSASRVRFVMASIEIRAGNLAQARALLRAAVADEPSTSGLTTLALVERQAGDAKAALDALDRARHAPDAHAAPLDVAEANLLAFEVFRDSDSLGGAKASLDAALASALAARGLNGGAPTKARAERLLGRILDGYGDTSGSSRAYERAMKLAAADRPALGAIMLDAIGRGLVRHNLPAARAALKRGLEGDANEDDLLYGGLWVALIERELHAPTDGTSEHALRAGGKSGWGAKLSAWAGGKLSDADLGTAAQSSSQRVEAAFYTAMGRRVAGDAAADQRLKAVATSPTIDLLEVQIARDLLARPAKAELPGNVKLP